MNNDAAQKIAAFAVKMYRIRGWAFTMRATSLKKDDYAEIERFIGEVSAEVDPTALCQQCNRQVGDSDFFPFCGEYCQDVDTNLAREEKLKKLRKGKRP